MTDAWHKLQDSAVRDLAWACFSPPLLLAEQLDDQPLANCTLELTPARQELLLAIDRDPAPLHAHLGRAKSTRLGLYFEALWHFFLAADEQIDLVAHNLPVREGGKTLGEFDVIYWCKQRQLHVHLELALKYYLGLPGQPVWLGPNQRDQLDNKVSHLVQQQIRLSEHSTSRALLASLGVADLQREIEIKGYLFDAPQPALRPAGLNSNNPLRRWQSLSVFRDNEPTAARWLALERSRWLAPLGAPTSELNSTAAIATHLSAAFEKGLGPIMLARFETGSHEAYRCFVTPDDWPVEAAGASTR